MKSNNIQDFPSFLKVSRFFWLSGIILILALTAQYTHKRTMNEVIDPQRIERLIQDRLAVLDSEMEELAYGTDKEEMAILSSSSENSLFVYDKDSLVYWSDNSLALPDHWSWQNYYQGLLEFPNLLGLCSLLSVDSIHVIGIIPLQYTFPIENEFLSNNFLIGGARSASYTVVPVSNVSNIIIHDHADQPLFGLERSNADRNFSVFWYLALVLFGLSLFLFLCFMLDLLKFAYSFWKSNWWLLFFAIDLFLLRWLLSFLEVPALFYNLSWFHPFDYPVLFFESQGEALESLIFILFLGLAINSWYRLYPPRIDEKTKSINPKLIDSFTAVGWLLVMGAWFGLNRFWVFLLQQCEDVIEIHGILSITFHSLMDIILMAISLAAFILILYRLSRQTLEMYSLKRYALVPIVTGVVFFGVTRFAGRGPDLISVGVLLILILICGISLSRRKNKLNQYGVVLILLTFSAMMVYFFDQSNKIKEEEIQLELLQNLSNEHDPIAELLLRRIDGEIISDSTLIEMVRNPRTEEEEVRNYLLSNQFELDWNRYEIKVSICDSVNLLNLSTEGITVGCLDYWNSMKDSSGQVLEDSHFYYVDNFDGIIWYLGVFPIFTADSAFVYHLNISVESILAPEGLGYPDVLIAGENRRDSLWDNYSYAKYQDCKLISRSGDFIYASSCESYFSLPDTIVHFEEGEFDHWISEIDERLIILSKPKTSILNHLISFSYLFVGFYIIWLILSLVLYLPQRIRTGGFDLKSKIQVSMVSTLVFSFILIGGGMNYFIVNQYDQTNRNTISEKIQSVLIELKHKLEYQDELSADWSVAGDYPNLQSLLVKFSYVFNTDINLYSPHGKMLASSRSEVFRKNLTGTLMNPDAFQTMNVQKQIELVHRENIGKLGYWSAYVPFYNVQGELLAYLNLPYFSKQSEIRKEVSTFMVAMINGYFLLIFLTVVFAVLLGNQLTRPLRILQERFTGMHLGGQNTQIKYHRKDEIGGLVSAYNQMVEELEASAELLARSERESAWREMAKQIAHEIKNPLTPMKLSVQQLKKSWDDRVEHWDEYLERVTITLVEQIDALTAIANEFSQFAKMPRAKREEFDLVAKVENSIALFMESGKSNILLDLKSDGPLKVFLDKEQLLQVLNNLINNAIQSVPQGREAEIWVRLSKLETTVVLAIIDNGSGIPDELQDKLFQPNFTTKTSGMGLGLAIAKNIVENSNGKIWFETGSQGTSFFIEFPLV